MIETKIDKTEDCQFWPPPSIWGKEHLTHFQVFLLSQPACAIANKVNMCSKLTIETLEQSMKDVQS